MSEKVKYVLTVILSFLLVMLLISVVFGQEPMGSLKGNVYNLNTKEPLAGATIILLNTKLGATTDIDGKFSVQNIPVGNYNLEIRSVGFETQIKTDINVCPERITQIDIELKEAIIETQGVTISVGYFNDEDENNLSVTSFNAEEIKRSPGSMGDVSRILLALPSVSKVSDENNDLVVRGGSPTENGFYIDGFPIPNINHFPSIGSTGGPIGILNVDFIDNFNFLTSGFSSSYGDKLSSVVDIKYRDGNKEEIDLQADLNWAGFGGGAEGPLPGKSGSWMVSFKRSYLDFFQKATGMGMFIRYGDAQAKVTYDLNKNHKISLLEIFADDYEKFDRDDAIDQGSSYYGIIKNYQNTTGISWRALWSKDFYSTTNLSISTQSFKNDFDKVSNGDKFYVSDNLEHSVYLKNINYIQLNRQNKFEAGLDINYSYGNYDYTRFLDTNRLGGVDPTYKVERKIQPQRYGGFLTYILSPFDRLTFNLGLRLDYYDLNRTTKFSPRITLAYDLTDKIKLSANSGIFYQQLPMVLLSQKDDFKKLENIAAYHFGIGFEYLVTPDTKFTFEVYDKEYDRLPLVKRDPSICVMDGGLSGNSFGNYDELQSIGRGYTRGIELLIQKKLAEDFYGIVSGSYFRSRYKDYNGTWRDRMYDNKFIFSFIGGYKPSRDWEFSLRWSYAGGIPYTPFDLDKSVQYKAGIIDENRINRERYTDYHSLNVRIDKKFFFSSQSIDIYLSVWNAYNRKNVTGYVWNVDKNEQKTVYQWSIMPIFGVEWEL